MSESSGKNGDAKVRWASVAITFILAAGAMTVQWGVVTTKLQQVEKRLDEFLGEARTLRAEYQAMEHRLSYLEGRLNAASGSTPGGGAP